MKPARTHAEAAPEIAPGKMIALAYDFDGTLAPGNLPEHGLLADLKIDKDDFWGETKRFAESRDCDEIIAYMHLLLQKCRERGLKLTRERFRSYGNRVPLFRGVDAWFKRINAFAAERGLAAHHFIISSGIAEMIESTPIAGEFRFIFASKYLYDDCGEAIGPGVAINYTTKTQYLFRINKGIFNFHDGVAINKWLPMNERMFPFAKMVYLGDGDTDIPAMKMTRAQGGTSIAVFDPAKWNDASQQGKIYKLIAEDRAQYVAPADFSNGSQLDIVVKGVIGKIERGGP